VEGDDVVHEDKGRPERATSFVTGRELAGLRPESLRSLAHELRTPLTIVRGYAELLVHRADGLGPHGVAQMGGEILAGSLTLARLVDDLLISFELDQPGFAICRRRLRLGRRLERLVRPYRDRPGGERIRTEVSSGLEVHADPDWLGPMIGHLLANALAYAPHGPIVVRAGRARGAVRVAVADEGPGLAPEEADRVWERFYRGAAAAASPSRGPGLGLPTVKRLVELHGGEVGVDSVLDGGATFWFTLRPPDAPTAG
jgi:signal transduction histidine kinase